MSLKFDHSCITNLFQLRLHLLLNLIDHTLLLIIIHHNVITNHTNYPLHKYLLLATAIYSLITTYFPYHFLLNKTIIITINIASEANTFNLQLLLLNFHQIDRYYNIPILTPLDHLLLTNFLYFYFY